MRLFVFLVLAILGAEAYIIGGGTQPGGGSNNNPSNPSTNNNNNNGIGGGVYPGNNGGGGTNPQRSEGGYCNSNSDCITGTYCTSSVNGVKICLSPSNGGGGGNSGGSGTCQYSSNCQSGSVCVITNGIGRCQIQTGGYVSPGRIEPSYDDFSDFSKNAPLPGKLNSACERDADCDDELSCTLYFGEMMCRNPIKPLIPLRCESDAECPSTEYLCVFSTAMQDKVCYKYGDVVTDGYVIPIKHKLSMELSTTPRTPSTIAESHAIFEDKPSEPGTLLSSALQKRADKMEPKAPIYVKMEMDQKYEEDGQSEIMGQNDGEAKVTTKVIVDEQKIDGAEKLVDDEPIDPMATVCQFDYHCRMGESCSGRVRFVDRNVTVCRYDILKKHRQCIYHSDCLSGQRCVAKSKDFATCETDISATIGVIPCFYDYECSGGEKCVLTDEKDRKFACRPSPTSDPRMNQMCTTNAQCPFQQVCRQSAGISMCVDVTISRNPARLQERLWRLLRNFIFHRTTI